MVKRVFSMRLIMAVFLCAVQFLCLPRTGSAAPPSLEPPVRCELGRDCFIQNYFDHDPGPGAVDYTCGSLVYDGHHGTDFRVRDLVAMRGNVEVVASASGVVAGVRDGEPDINVKQRGKAALKGKDAGNGVRIEHGDGWSTQYSHLMLGSIRVRPGQRVKAGDVLGLIGLSGNTEFPHVDLTVRHNEIPVDPFNVDTSACGTRGAALWSPQALRRLYYQAGGLLISGFADVPPRRDLAEAGGYANTPITVESGGIIFWVEMYGLRKGDRLIMDLLDPSRRLMSRNDKTVPANAAVWFATSGKRRNAPQWPKGVYEGVVKLERAGKVIVEERKTVEIR